MPNPFPPGARLAAYLRDSGGEKQDLSVAQQESAIRRWCNEYGLLLTAIFTDQARPGSSVVSRSAFQDCIYHFRQPGCPETGLLLWSYSRFARDIDDAQFYRADLRRRGFTIHSINDDIPDGPMGRLFEAAIDWKNEQFLEDLSRDVRRGLRNLVEKFGAVPGTPPRGFRRAAVAIGSRRDGKTHTVHRWEPDPELAPLVRQAFELRLAGKSLHQINQETRLYKSLNCYTTFFANPLYKGELRYGDLTIPDYCAPIVPPDLWEAIQAVARRYTAHQNLRAENNDHPRRQASSYLLSGLLYCARCGSPMFGLTAKQRDGTYHARYACTRQKRSRDCPAQPIPAIFLENLILDQVTTRILDPEILAAIQSRALEIGSRSQGELDQRRKSERQALGRLRRQIERLTAAVADAGHSRALLQKLSALEADEALALARLAQFEREQRIIPKKTAPQLEEISATLVDQLHSVELTIQRAALRGLVDRITIERDGNLVRGLMIYYFPPDPPPKALAPPDGADTVSIVPAPLGAPFHRHRFQIPVEAAIVRPYTKRKRP